MKNKFNFISRSIKQFVSFNKDIKNYIYMHSIGGLFFSYTILYPILMYRMDITILEVGIIFSVAAFIDALLTFILSKFFDRISPNKAMAMDWITESFPAFVFSFAFTYLHFFVGAIAQKLTNVLNSVYRIYENKIFPEEDRKLIYTYHLFIPEITKLIALPILGYLLTFIFDTIFALRVTLFICGIGFLLTSLIPLKVLKRIEPQSISNEKVEVNNKKITKKLYLVAISEILILICGQLSTTYIISYYMLEEMNASVMNILLIECIGSGITVLVGLLGSNIINKINSKVLIKLGLIFFVIYNILMGISKFYDYQALTLIMVATILQSIGHTLWFPSHSSVLMKLVPKENSGLFFGRLSSISKIMTIIIPSISGIVAAKFGFVYIFFSALVLYLIVFFIYNYLLSSF